MAEFRPSGNAGRHAIPLTIRVIDYHLDDGRGAKGPYRLFTTLLDPVEAPAQELAFAYAQRWEIELAFDELKAHQRGPKAVLRSKSPALVEQEIWGHLCCHYAIRTLMFEAAHDAGVDPDRVSFIAALRITQRSLSQARDFPPPGDDHDWTCALILLARRLRSNPRLIKPRCPNGTSNAPTTPTGLNPPDHPPPPSSASN